MLDTIRVCIGQMEVIPGNPAANLKEVLRVIDTAKNQQADIVVLPEMCIPGYLIGDLWEQRSFVAECVNCNHEIRLASNGIVVVWGNVSVDTHRKGEDGRQRKFNTCYVAKDQHYITNEFGQHVIKTLQPNYREFDDNRHFYDKRKLLFDELLRDRELTPVEDTFEPAVVNIRGSLVKLGCMLCEDGWDDDYTVHPIHYLAPRSDILINISCSPYTSGKNGKRNRIFSTHARKHHKPLVYVNNVGCQNNSKTVYVFDGSSCVYDCEGNQFYPFTPFTECQYTVTIPLKAPFTNPTYSYGNTTYEKTDDISLIHEAIRYGVQRFMAQQGLNKLIIAASGGIDSSVVAVIASEVVQAKNLVLLNMPSRYNSEMTQTAARKLADNLKCRYEVYSINELVITLKNHPVPLNGAYELNGLIDENIQARARLQVLATHAAALGAVFTCNSNKTETTVGYCTFYGDLSGFMAPIADLWKTQVYELSHYLNEIYPGVIPQASIDVKPSAELSSNQDVMKGLGDPLIFPYHDKLFASWVENWNRSTPETIARAANQGVIQNFLGLSAPLSTYFKSHEEFLKDLEYWWMKYQGLAVAKRCQAPPILAVSRRAFGFDHRECIGQPYFTKEYYRYKELLLEVQSTQGVGA